MFEGLLTGRDHLFSPVRRRRLRRVAVPALTPVPQIEPDDDELFHHVLHERMTLGPGHVRLRDWIARVASRPQA